MTTTYRDGDVTVTLDDGLAAFVRGLMTAAERTSVEVCERHAREVADAAERDWYGPGGVTRRTGRSGDIDTETRIGAAEVRVRAYSTDTRRAGKGGKPVPVYVHRAAATSSVAVEVTEGEWWGTQRASRGPRGDRAWTAKQREAFGAPGRWLVLRQNPKAGDGKYLLTELLRKPGKARERDIAREIAVGVERG